MFELQIYSFKPATTLNVLLYWENDKEMFGGKRILQQKYSWL